MSSPAGAVASAARRQVDRRRLVERGQQADPAAPDHDVAAVLGHEQAAVGAQHRLDVAAVGGAADGEVDALGQREVGRAAVAHACGPPRWPWGGPAARKHGCAANPARA